MSPEMQANCRAPSAMRPRPVFGEGMEFTANGIDLVVKLAHRKGLVVAVKTPGVDPRENGFHNGKRLRFPGASFKVASLGRHAMQLKCLPGTTLRKRRDASEFET